MTDEDRPDRRTDDAEGADGTRAGTPDDEVWAALVASFHASPDARPDEDTVADEPVGTSEGGDPDGPTTDPTTDPTADSTTDPTTDPTGTEPAARAPTPRSWAPAEPLEEHFVPPPVGPGPPLHPLTKAAWLATIGGPMVLLAIVLTGWDAPSWAIWGCTVAFVAGFVTLVARMHGHDDEHGGNGAVV
jgi:hypothetical protein